MAYKTEAELHELNFSLNDENDMQLIDVIACDEMDGEHYALYHEALEAGFESIVDYLAT